MPGGLINIVTYGSQDIFLTGTPEITHFKIVYRRHTNFSMESVRLKFDDDVNFGVKSSIQVPQVGDLIHKGYLEIILPEMKFKRKTSSYLLSQAESDYETYMSDYKKIMKFMRLNFDAYRDAYDVYLAENETDYTVMFNQIQLIFEDVANQEIIDNCVLVLQDISEKLDGITNMELGYDAISVYAIGSEMNTILSISGDDAITKKNSFKQSLDTAVKNSQFLVKYFQEKIQQLKKTFEDVESENYKFAWVSRIGHSIIDYIDVFIGGDKIDRHYGDWINIWYELTTTKELEKNYMKMIGDIPELTTFDRTAKPKTTIYVPLSFWFNRFNGLSLPLVGLEYHDTSFEIKLKKFSECAYIEDDDCITETLDNLYEDSRAQVQVNLMLDFIYLDGPERRKFAQSAHEYLIDVVYLMEDLDIDRDEHTIFLDFNNPIKELIWVFQKTSRIKNKNGHNKCQWTNYGVNTDGTKNPLLSARLELNGYTRIDDFEGGYFNLLQTHNFHTNSPVDGINCYSFSLIPEENQPGGTCNFSRISLARLNLEIDSSMFIADGSDEENTDTVRLRVYGRGQNVLRIIGGMAGLAYQ